MGMKYEEDNIFSDIPLKMKQESVVQEKDITKKLYQDYSQFKTKLYDNLLMNNDDYGELELFKKSQKLLDRFLFILFGEDTGLLPANTICVKKWSSLLK